MSCQPGLPFVCRRSFATHRMGKHPNDITNLQIHILLVTGNTLERDLREASERTNHTHKTDRGQKFIICNIYIRKSIVNCEVGIICCVEYVLYCKFKCTMLQFFDPGSGINHRNVEKLLDKIFRSH